MAKSAVDSTVATAVTYYQNRKAQFEAFIEDAKLSPDTNDCERSLRPAAIMRHATNFKQSVEYLEVLCRCLSIVETAKINGIEDPMKWMNAFSNAYFSHCMDEATTRRHEEGLTWAKFKTFDEAAKQSFNVTPLLPWNYGKNDD